MKVLVASTIVPFVGGGGRIIVSDLVRHLREHGHEVDEILIPFSTAPTEIVEQMLAIRLLDVSAEADRLITIRTPSYLLAHHAKVVWFIHHHRGAYDLWGTEYQDIPSNAEGLLIRRAILDADNTHLREARRLFTNSRLMSDRLYRHNGLSSEVLYPPLGDVAGYRCDSFGDYIFYPSRIAYIKRQVLLLESLAFVKSDVRVVIAGAPDRPEDLARLQAVVARLGVGERVELLSTWISEEHKRELFANALACAYLPYDEDSYGYVTLESFSSRKPVITCSDSGGTLELVEDGVTGRVVEPDPRALAEAIDQLRGDVALARELGEAGHERMRTMNISWDHVIERLLA
jgi:glycosyltransferase involved in cell wall biosynthesis